MRRREPPQQAQARRRLDHDALARQMLGERVALRPLALEAGDRRRFGDSLLRGEFVFRRARFQLFELERQLIDQPRRALRLLPVDLTLQLGDPQLLRAISAISSDAFARATASSAFSAAFSSSKGLARGVHETK